jgi:excisionase family DNA binding protein
MRSKAQEFKPEPSPYVTVNEAAQILYLSEPTVRRLLTEKRLRRFKSGGRTLLLRSDVLSFIKEEVVA